MEKNNVVIMKHKGNKYLFDVRIKGIIQLLCILFNFPGNIFISEVLLQTVFENQNCLKIHYFHYYFVSQFIHRFLFTLIVVSLINLMLEMLKDFFFLYTVFYTLFSFLKAQFSLQ